MRNIHLTARCASQSESLVTGNSSTIRRQAFARCRSRPENEHRSSGSIGFSFSDETVTPAELSMSVQKSKAASFSPVKRKFAPARESSWPIQRVLRFRRSATARLLRRWPHPFRPGRQMPSRALYATHHRRLLYRFSRIERAR